MIADGTDSPSPFSTRRGRYPTGSSETSAGASGYSRRWALRLFALAPLAIALGGCVVGPSQATPVPQPQPTFSPAASPAPTPAASGTAGPVGTGTPNATVAIRLTTAGTQAEITAFQGLVDSFNQKNPDTKVTHEPVVAGYEQQTLAALSSGNAPDVVAVDGLSLGSWIKQALLADVDAALTDAKVDRTGPFLHLTDAFASAGATYGLPYAYAPTVLYVNKASFDKAKQPLPDQSWTWDTFTQAAKALTTSDSKQVGFAPGTGVLDWSPWAVAGGGMLFNSAIDPSTCLLDSPEAAQGVQAYADLWLKGGGAANPVAEGASDPATLFAGSVAAMAAGPTSWIAAFQAQSSLTWDVSFLPAGPGGHAMPIAVAGLAVGKSSTKVPAAVKLLGFLCATTESQVALGKTGTLVPAYRPAAFSNDYLQAQPGLNRKVLVQAMDFGLGPFRSPYWTDVANILDPGMQPVWKGSATAADTLKALTPRVTAALQQGRATPTPAATGTASP